ncbi:RNA-binding cell elongation regulator Jag/EloR [Limosilactobacillus fastidiosus]|uniref:RNA-binding protein KhpB n=1 Tax=Limosilactobacillus fastidiosus TaxID=2759855 RepID=A0A7W3TYT8_9LACO|nr:RNA-binding cell elongation regulator Jag/EloR [Limosilactobacillus fastidiosus]MBB1062524.1 Jag N-terminal domain-containing protein [Limosilactobacillus fastidiosus]MBB1085525.1 Jag N-terminal domain-containing protein [Limosilactobacillus fastidiosus]MCD7083598.1 Jag N-terminal domain-containing protein [Limosilactobacillus fastidiosus]MCD7085978.1 Jag N-terminal domain-containing protein [Limosilactobacillus fastidiosus]MCD7114378.1 Jag N-terminal domain-containing protein [Limosilactob
MGRYTGETVEQAVASASKRIGVAKEQLEITIVQQARHGFLGIGRRNAIIEVSVNKTQKKAEKHEQIQKSHNTKRQSKRQRDLKPRYEPVKENEVDPAEMKRRHEQNVKRVKKVSQDLAKYLKDVFKNLGIEVNPIIKDVRSHEVKIDLQSEQSGRIIGHHGRRINAIEQISNAFMNYLGAEKTTVILDTADYRQRREESLQQLAERSVMEVVSTGQAVFLDPMPARERKQLHQELQDNPHVKTYSHGREPYRSVVIAPKN